MSFTSLQSLKDLAQDCINKPFYLLSKNKQQKYLSTLKDIISNFKSKIKTKGNIYQLITNLEKTITKKEIDETIIALSLLKISEICEKEKNKEIRFLAKELKEYTQKFSTRTKLWQVSLNRINSIKEEKTDEEMKKIDVETLKTEGLFYCLEYYLAVYRALKESDDEKKKYYLENKKIEFGTGPSTGLLEDFSHDEALYKFILQIINDDWRNALVNSYYGLKIALNKIILKKNEDNQEYYEYQISFDELLEKYKIFLMTFLETAQTAGLEKISSVLYKAYGENPTIDEVKQQL